MNAPESKVEHITVIGAGTMGSQIAMVCALSGFETALVDLNDEALERAREQLWSRLDRDMVKGRRTKQEVQSAKEHLSFGSDLVSAAMATDCVIEAAVEDLGIKRKLFAQLDDITPSHALLVTNSSNIVSSLVAEATTRPDKVCNMHFFNPAMVMECVEVVPHGQTSTETVQSISKLAESLGKSVVTVNKEIPGFVANRLLNAIRKEALYLYNNGVASVEDIDRAAKTALRHPMGPFELMDLVGLDVVYLIRMAEYKQTGDPESLPDPAVTDLYKAGRLGRKSGSGWYDYAG
ncbi:3-hydroxyacyl-CoA dehydrogenase family protein [Glutamicibacter sp. NPDC127525]|uniref:3-hydroxyacyl-CoA dehydrogenase family protein n=1 Tax=unclassified Glutamicibacter TaxID=2627139 RepID=UPI00362D724B